MGRYIKYGMLAMMIVGGGFALYELKQVAELKKDLDSGMSAERAIERLVEKDKTGIVSKVVEAHQAGMDRIDGVAGMQAAAEAAAAGDPDAARRLSEAAKAVSGSAARSGGFETGALTGVLGAAGSGAGSPARSSRLREAKPLAPSTITVLAPGEKVEAGPGVAVLVDEKTGERIVLRSSRKPARRLFKSGGASLLDKIPGLPSIPASVRKALGLPEAGSLQARKMRAYALLGGTVFGTMLLVLWVRRKFR
jgi:hypothetical protein